jgi:cell division septation protein DedD
MRTVFLLLGMVLLTTAAPAGSAAQTTPTLDRVEELTRQGMTAEAREVLQAWWSSQRSRASRNDLQRGLWLRGRLTTDPAQADLDFRRLVVEYPGGPFSDQALFRLAQLAHAAGDSAVAAGYVDRLVQEYPASPVRREAQAWLATAGPVPEPPATGTPGAAPAHREQRAVAPPGAPGPQPTAAPPKRDPEPVGRGDFTIQLGAFSTLERAEALLRRVSDAGFEGRLVTVPGSELIRVRVGTFDSADGANQVLWRLRDQDFTAQLARDAQREERVIR